MRACNLFLKSKLELIAVVTTQNSFLISMQKHIKSGPQSMPISRQGRIKARADWGVATGPQYIKNRPTTIPSQWSHKTLNAPSRGTDSHRKVSPSYAYMKSWKHSIDIMQILSM